MPVPFRSPLAAAALAAPFVAALAAALPASAGAATPARPVALLPLPQSIVPARGSFTVVDGTQVAGTAGDAGTAGAVRLLIEHVARARGLTLRETPDVGAAPIRFVRDPAIVGAEAYRLSVDRRGIRIAASGDAGLVYGAMTLVQLIGPDRRIGRAATVPAMMIDDRPRFAWRGLMLDVARHFQPLPVLYAIVDQMAAVKLNTLHLHLTDDQGWRFEVKRYPKLTTVGALRTPPAAGGAPGPAVGGFYTQDELRALVAFARLRGIAIVPEIDLPGHAQALVAAYPEFGMLGDRPPVGHDWGVNPYLFNPGPAGVAFVKTVLDELMAVFPGDFVHLGGDEAVKDQWQRSPAAQAQIAALGLKDENGLQSWLIDQFGAYLAAHGRRLIGWDEILEGGLPPSASVMSWRGDKGAVAAAMQDHDVVLAPAPTLYLDSLQSDRGDEPPGRLSIRTLEDLYAYEPMPAGLPAAKAGRILGAEATAFSEYLVTPYQVQHAIFPRIGALAEKTWSAKGADDFAGFLARLDPQATRWRRAGVEVADSAFAVGFRLTGTPGDAIRAHRATVALATQVAWGRIRYTLDGTTPTIRAAPYRTPLSVVPGTTIRAAAFAADGSATAAPRTFDTSVVALLTRTASELVECPRGKLGLRVPLTAEATANAPAFNINLFDTCSLYPDAPLDVAGGFVVEVARLPRHYGLAHDVSQLREQYAVTPHGELIVQIGCRAAALDKAVKPIVAATFPLPDPATAPTRFTLTGTLPRLAGDRDVCLQFTSPLADPYYAVERIRLTARTR